MSAADQHKEKIICMLESINDEKFLNQIRSILKWHIERGGKKHERGTTVLQGRHFKNDIVCS